MIMILIIIVVVRLWSFLGQFSSYLDEICSDGVLWSDQLSTSSNASCNVMSGFYDVLKWALLSQLLRQNSTMEVNNF